VRGGVVCEGVGAWAASPRPLASPHRRRSRGRWHDLLVVLGGLSGPAETGVQRAAAVQRPGLADALAELPEQVQGLLEVLGGRPYRPNSMWVAPGWSVRGLSFGSLVWWTAWRAWSWTARAPCTRNVRQ